MFETNKHSSSELQDKPQNMAKDYIRTSNQQKIELIDLVINQKYSMKLASEIVGVKLSTVKYIIKAYKTDKQYFMDKLKPKKMRFQKEKKKQTPKSKPPTNLDPVPILQEPKELNSTQPNSSETNLGFTNQSGPLYIQNFPFFQNYFHYNPLLNNLAPFDNNWTFTYLGN